MQINPLVSSRGIGSTTGTTQTSAQTQTLNQNDFLKLLSTQLANQDPTKPQDNSQLEAQLAQFATVQGVTNLETSATQIQSANLIGKTIQASVVTNNVPQSISGQVTAVSWSGSGVNLTLNDKNQTVVTMPQITQVSQ